MDVSLWNWQFEALWLQPGVLLWHGSGGGGWTVWRGGLTLFLMGPVCPGGRLLPQSATVSVGAVAASGLAVDRLWWPSWQAETRC